MATFVSGNITTDTIWTSTASPYVLSGDVYVDNSAILTISPGASVYGGYAGTHALEIYGGSKLIVNGQKDKIVRFLGAYDTSAYTYGGYIFVDGTIDANYLEISKWGNYGYGYAGIIIDSAPDNFLLNNCKIYNCYGTPASLNNSIIELDINSRISALIQNSIIEYKDGDIKLLDVSISKADGYAPGDITLINNTFYGGTNSLKINLTYSSVVDWFATIKNNIFSYTKSTALIAGTGDTIVHIGGYNNFYGNNSDIDNNYTLLSTDYAEANGNAIDPKYFDTSSNMGLYTQSGTIITADVNGNYIGALGRVYYIDIGKKLNATAGDYYAFTKFKFSRLYIGQSSKEISFALFNGYDWGIFKATIMASVTIGAFQNRGNNLSTATKEGYECISERWIKVATKDNEWTNIGLNGGTPVELNIGTIIAQEYKIFYLQIDIPEDAETPENLIYTQLSFKRMPFDIDT